MNAGNFIIDAQAAILPSHPNQAKDAPTGFEHLSYTQTNENGPHRLMTAAVCETTNDKNDSFLSSAPIIFRYFATPACPASSIVCAALKPQTRLVSHTGHQCTQSVL